ncbi:MAG: T9SS type A sorting domain-containing protein, partial [Ferruginibacter sp.]
FTNGFLNLNGFNADLGTTGHLDGETESSRVIGPNGGEVLFNVNLNAPTGSNPGNLRLFITSGQDLGNVTIRRGHQSQTTTTGAGSSVLRYYEIASANNANLNATLRFSYFNGELNNLAESPLVFFEKQSNGNFSNIGFTSRDTVANFVEKAGINSFSRFTLDNTGNPLPVLFVLFNARCEGNSVIIHWKTAQEQNSSRFDIERSTDAIHWTVIGRLPAAGSSSTEKSYSMIDNNPLLNNYYRIAEYDLDSKVQYTGLLRSSCSAADNITVWPNPVHDDNLYINIVAAGKSGAEIKVFDSKGVLVKLQRDTVLQGSNQSRINTSSLPKGTYLISAEWNNGQNKKTIQVIKQ